jgi:hypothetical protein
MNDPLELVSGYLDHALGDAEVVELEAWILADPKHVATFARRAVVHSQIRDALAGEVSLRLSKLRSPELFEPIEEANGVDLEADFPHSLSDAMIMLALVESDATDGPAPIELPHNKPSVEEHIKSRFRVPSGRTIRRVGAAAAIILICLSFWAWRVSSRPVATLTATVGSVWEQSGGAPALGEPLSSGKTLQLTKGFAEFKYASGARVVVEGPATFVLNSGSRMTLLHGRLTASVPTPAHGFTVSTPVGTIVDLGTEFGVNVASETVVETRVFRGRIQVQGNDDASATPLIVAAGQGARLESSGVSLEPAPADSEQYVLDVHQIVESLPTHGTGQNLNQGDDDPNWQITSVPNDPLWTPEQAEVSDRLDFYVPNDSKAAWVSTADDLPPVAPGQYTFATTFDLSGFDPSSAHLHLNLSADDKVAEVRINGVAVPIPSSFPDHWFSPTYPLDIDTGFVSGVNRLEIIVYNEPGQSGGLSQMGLRADVSGTAVRNVDAQ